MFIVSHTIKRNFLFLFRKFQYFLFALWNNLIIFLCSNEEKQFKFLVFPSEFNKNLQIESRESFIGYIPWIESHTKKLVVQISNQLQFPIVPVLFFNLSDNMSRARVNKFVRLNEKAYRIFVRKIIVSSRLQGVIFTFDWLPTMRIIVEECKLNKIPTILIPHEGVFLDENKYYWDEKTGVSCPSCDYILGWGKLQKKIFCGRGYPEKRIFIVGSPKLDECSNFLPTRSKKEFFSRYGFDASKPTILFASQFLDIQVDINFAQLKQNEIISDLIDYCNKKDCQLIIRMPPNGVNILNDKNQQQAMLHQNIFIDNSKNYLSSATDAIYYSSLLVSINSTMLFEAVLMSKNALAVHYFDVNPPWGKKLILSVHNKTELFDAVESYCDLKPVYDSNELKNVAELFGVGTFDGKSVQRIAEKISFIIENKGIEQSSHVL